MRSTRKKLMACLALLGVLLGGCAKSGAGPKPTGQMVADSAESSPTPDTLETAPEKWLDLQEEDPPEDAEYTLALPEFPGVRFICTPLSLTAQKEGEEDALLLVGWPLKQVWLWDINGDGLREFCASAWMGFGVVDSRVLVYDYGNLARYQLQDRMQFNYDLDCTDGALFVSKTGWGEGQLVWTRRLSLEMEDMTAVATVEDLFQPIGTEE